MTKPTKDTKKSQGGGPELDTFVSELSPISQNNPEILDFLTALKNTGSTNGLSLTVSISHETLRRIISAVTRSRFTGLKNLRLWGSVHSDKGIEICLQILGGVSGDCDTDKAGIYWRACNWVESSTTGPHSSQIYTENSVDDFPEKLREVEHGVLTETNLAEALDHGAAFEKKIIEIQKYRKWMANLYGEESTAATSDLSEQCATLSGESSKMLRCIEEFHITDCTITNKGCAFLGLVLDERISYSKLRCLSLDYNTDIGDEGVTFLASALANNSLLSWLSLKYCSISSIGGRALASSLSINNSNVETLDLTGNKVDTIGVIAMLEKLISSPRLSSIRLDLNKIEGSREFIVALAHCIQENTRIHSYYFQNNDFTEINMVELLKELGMGAENTKSTVPHLSNLILTELLGVDTIGMLHILLGKQPKPPAKVSKNKKKK